MKVEPRRRFFAMVITPGKDRVPERGGPNALICLDYKSYRGLARKKGDNGSRGFHLTTEPDGLQLPLSGPQVEQAVPVGPVPGISGAIPHIARRISTW